MKEVKTIVNIPTEVIVFKAFDGQEFARKDECLAHENSIRTVAINEFEKLPHYEVENSQFGIPFYCDDNRTEMVVPRNAKDLFIINSYINRKLGENYYQSNKPIVDDSMIGKVVILSWSYDEDYCDVYEMSSYLLKIANHCEEMRAKFKAEFGY